jgi:hypothetical protein
LVMEISAREIEDLEPPQFIDFVNSLISAEAHVLGIPTTDLKLNSYTTGSDGGVDGSIDDSGMHGNNEWVPSGLSIWQFKTDRSHTNATPSKLKEEASKTGVLEALKAGGRYVVAIARICDKDMRSERENALRDTIKANGFNPNLVTLLTADDLKTWAVKHYSLLLLPFFMRPFGECLRMEKWELDKVVEDYVTHSEAKFQNGNSEGKMQRRHLSVSSIVHIGKEANELEEVEILGLDDASYVKYLPAAVMERLEIPKV